MATEKFRTLAADFNLTAAGAIAWLVNKGPNILPIPGKICGTFKEMVQGSMVNLSEVIGAIENVLPIGWALESLLRETMGWSEKYC